MSEFTDIINSNTKDYAIKTGGDMVGAIMGDPLALANVFSDIKNAPIMIRDQIYLTKFWKFLAGIYENEEDTVKIGIKLFGDEEDAKRNVERICQYIERAECESTIDYMVNASKSFLLGLIDRSDYMRILRAISDTMFEDLDYLKSIALADDEYTGSMKVQALVQNGLMIQSGIDANENVENQLYVVTKLGMMVDRYAISFEDEEQAGRYDRRSRNRKNMSINTPSISSEEIDQIINGVYDNQ